MRSAVLSGYGAAVSYEKFIFLNEVFMNNPLHPVQKKGIIDTARCNKESDIWKRY